MSNNTFLKSLCNGIPDTLPTLRLRDESIPHAPYRNNQLNREQKQVIFFLLTVKKVQFDYKL